MIESFINKCGIDNTSHIININTDFLNVNKLKNLPTIHNFGIDFDDVDGYCESHNIDTINMLIINFEEISPITISGMEHIINSTEYICVDVFTSYYINDMLPGVWHEAYRFRDNSNISDSIDQRIHDIRDEFNLHGGSNWMSSPEIELGPLYIVYKNINYRNSTLNENGSWNTKDLNEHYFDTTLSADIIKFFKSNSVSHVIDLGCGPGEYVQDFNNNNINTKGVDGNPATPELTNGLCEILDLSTEFNLGIKYECVVSLEVGEHIPQQYESTFINNIISHSSKYVIMSWAVPEQGGYGHVNCQSNEYIKEIFDNNGFKNLSDVESSLRSNSTAPWFKNTILVFEKNNNKYGNN